MRYVALVVLAAASLMAAQAKEATEKKAPAKQAPAKGGVLHPEMTPGSGTYESPAGKLGEKPSKPWSSTTVEAAVDGKPNAGHVKTVSGEIVDLSCYLQLGKHGDKHRDCGQKCLRSGQPIGLVTKDGSLYMLMEEEHHPRRDSQTNFRDVAIEHMGHVMEVTGTEASVGGHKALYVTGSVRK